MKLPRLVLASTPLLLVCVVLSLPDGASGKGPASALSYLNSNGIGPAHFGTPQRAVIAALRPSLGKPNATGINTGCGKNPAEVAWHDLIAEFRDGRFSGYRYIRGGWPLKTPGSRRRVFSCCGARVTVGAAQAPRRLLATKLPEPQMALSRSCSLGRRDRTNF
jgi:hypothetical protein